MATPLPVGSLANLHSPASAQLANPSEPAASGIEVVHADDDLLVLHKPAGLLCVPGRGTDKQDCLSRRAQQHYPDALIVHRLDMATSGLLLMARGARMQRALSRLFENREVNKRYIAVVDGRLHEGPPQPVDADGWHLIDLPIALDWPHRPLRIIDAAQGKPSQTRWRAIRFDEASHSTRVTLEPLTGRSHQLRVHLKAIGHPILGDALYAPAQALEKAPRLLLHAAALAFTQPQSHQVMHFTCEPDF